MEIDGIADAAADYPPKLGILDHRASSPDSLPVIGKQLFPA